MYEYLFNSYLNPFFESAIKKRKILEYRHDLETSQWLTRDKILAIQWEKLEKLLTHAYEKVPFWHQLFETAKIHPLDISTYADFRRLPLTSKQTIISNSSNMLANGYEKEIWSKYTGGSTGTTLRVFLDPQSYQHRAAATKRGYGWANCEDGRKQFYLWGTADHRATGLAKYKLNLHRKILRHKYFDCFQFSDNRKRECVSIMNRFKPRVIVGYPEALFRLARFIEKNNCELRFAAESIITGAEKIFDTQREIIERVFNTKIFDSYGSREFMLIAMECPAHRGLHVTSENILLEIVDEHGQPVSPGEQGEVVITDLHNYGMPFIRYRMGDMAVQESDDCSCPCGRGLPRIREVSGRVLDMITLSDGNEIPGEFFVRFVGAKPGVSQFRVIQTALDQLLIELIVDDQFTAQTLDAIKEDIYRILDESIKLEFRFVNELDVTPTGKFRVTISSLQ